MPTIPLEQQLAAALQKHVVFSLLEGEELAQLAKELEMVAFALGETVLNEGDRGDCAFLIYAGKVRVFKGGPAGKAITLATLGAGDIFGEHAILQDEARSASVRASEDCVLFRIPRAAFTRLLRGQPSLTPYLERLQRQRALHRFLQMGTILGAVPARQVLALLDQFEECNFSSGQVVFREGEPGDRMYIIHTGEAKIVKGGPGQETVLLYLGPSDYFGERVFILDEPRYASVVAITDLTTFSLSRENFSHLKNAAPQLLSQLTRRLEQYPLAEEMARKFGVKPQIPTAAADLGRTVALEKLEDPQEGQPALNTARPTPASGPRTWWGFLRPFPFLSQENETDCGAASLAMIAAYHKAPLSVDQLRDLAHVGADGASLLSLTKAAETIGFQWRAVNTDDGHLEGLTLPAIAHWQAFHYVVLYACAGNKVILGDPARGLVKMSRHEFAAGWTGGLLLLTPSSDLRRHAFTRRGLLTPFRNALAGLIMLSAVLAVIQVAFPLIIQRLVDWVLAHRDAKLPLTLSVGLLLAGISMGAALHLRSYLVERLLERMSGKLTADWFDRLLMLPWRYLQSRTVGRLLTPLERSRAVNGAGAGYLLTSLLDLWLLVVGLGVLLSYDLMLACITLGSWILSTSLQLVGALRARTIHVRSGYQEASTRTAWVEVIQASLAIRDAGAESELRRRHQDLLANPADSAHRSSAFKVVSWTAAIHALAAVYVLWYGAYLVLEGQLTIGQLVAVQCLVGLMAIPILGLERLWPAFVEFRGFLLALAENAVLLPDQDLAKPDVSLPRLRSLIRFDLVAYRPYPESRALLSHINLELRPGQIAWLVGRSGAGKTTLALLLQRLLVPSEGQITWDGIDLATAELNSLRSQVSFISEEPALLQGTIKENIALADHETALEQVIGAAKLACAHDFIMGFPRAYDTMLGPGGVQLSRGQRQALSIARGLLKNPRLLILDEATSALDAETERAVLKNMRWLAGDRATLILSRRPLAVQPNDLVIVLEEGQIVDQGTHDQLLKQPGLYSFLAERLK